MKITTVLLSLVGISMAKSYFPTFNDFHLLVNSLEHEKKIRTKILTKIFVWLRFESLMRSKFWVISVLDSKNRLVASKSVFDNFSEIALFLDEK